MSNGFKKPKISPEPKHQTKIKAIREEKPNVKKPLSTAGHKDIIISVSAITLLLACAIVAGSTIYDKNFPDSSRHAITYGDTIGIKYVGSLHTYYDRYENPTIFDTNIKSIDTANKENHYFTKEWREDDNKYNVHNIVVGNKQLPEAIEEAIIGHHRGNTIELAIDSASVYSPISKTGSLKKNYDYSIDRVKTFSSNFAFKEFFGVDAPETFFTVKSPYGWNANVIKNFNNLIDVIYLPETSKDYDGGTGIIYKVSKVTSDRIVFQYDFSYNSRAIQAVSPQGEELVYINEQTSDTEYKYKTKFNAKRQIAGEALYFTTKIVS